jgi:hypothetical protein
MTEPTARRIFVDLVHKGRALAERRRDHFIAIFEAGRWTHYSSESEYRARLEEAAALAERWAALARQASALLNNDANAVAAPAVAT